MKSSTRLLINDMLMGLLVAAAFGALAPHFAMAQQSLDGAVDDSSVNVFNPFIKIISYVSYAMGTVMVVAGIAHAKKHADNPGSNPLGPALGRLGAGAAFLAAPAVIGMMQTTSSQVTGGGTSSFQTIGVTN